MALDPLLDQIQSVTNLIKRYDRKIARIAETSYPATKHLEQIRGVGPLTALGFVLTIGSSSRIIRSRNAGAYFGLRPRRYQSGESNPQLGISKEGDGFMRRMLAAPTQPASVERSISTPCLAKISDWRYTADGRSISRPEHGPADQVQRDRAESAAKALALRQPGRSRCRRTSAAHGE
jgi:hypothetical protein